MFNAFARTNIIIINYVFRLISLGVVQKYYYYSDSNKKRALLNDIEIVYLVSCVHKRFFRIISIIRVLIL